MQSIMDDDFWRSLDLIQADVRDIFELNQVSKHKRALQCFRYLVCEMERSSSSSSIFIHVNTNEQSLVK